MIIQLIETVVTKLFQVANTIFEWLFGDIQFNVLWSWLPSDIQAAAAFFILHMLTIQQHNAKFLHVA